MLKKNLFTEVQKALFDIEIRTSVFLINKTKSMDNSIELKSVQKQTTLMLRNMTHCFGTRERSIKRF